MYAGDVNLRVFRRGANIKKVELLALLYAVLELAWSYGSHINFSK